MRKPTPPPIVAIALCCLLGPALSARAEESRWALEVYTNAIRMQFRKIPGQTWAMGVHEVTNAQYGKFKPGHMSGDFGGHSLDGETQPVVWVSRVDAEAFCRWLSEKEGKTYRLPSEAEWDLCARAGRGEMEFPWGNEWPPPKGAGNYADASAKRAFPDWGVIEGYDDGHPVTAPVGSFAANPWGLYDMGGNVWEWTLGNEGSSGVLRGASWDYYLRGHLRLAYRYDDGPSGLVGHGGFRVVWESVSSRRAPQA